MTFVNFKIYGLSLFIEMKRTNVQSLQCTISTNHFIFPKFHRGFQNAELGICVCMYYGIYANTHNLDN